jgi:hypothetical protein
LRSSLFIAAHPLNRIGYGLDIDRIYKQSRIARDLRQ